MFAIKNSVIAAEKRIRNYVRETVSDYSIALSRITGSQVYLKCENLQYTSSFKVRGAFNKLLTLTNEEKQQGIVTASTGNHGAAVAYALKALKLKGKVFVPKNASPTKVENIKNYGASLEFFGTDSRDTELHALEYARENGSIYISPYNDPEVISGQGVIGVELQRQLPTIDAIFVPVGGGGLIAGIAGYIKETSAKTKIIGCLPENSPVMAASIKAGHIVEMETKPTISDATAGGLEPGSITFPICQKYVDDFILVTEEEIKDAIVTIMQTQHLMVEGAAGVAIAAHMKHADQFQDQNVVIILSGANISLQTLKSILN